MNPSEQLWKIGELAEKTGLTVRTLHHYEELGLLIPSRRSAANYRLYDSHDIARLHLIVSLKSLGLSLQEIRGTLARRDIRLEDVLTQSMERLRKEIERNKRLLERLEGIVRFGASGMPAAEDMLSAIALMGDIERFWTDEEMDAIREQGKALGKRAILSAEQEWPRLIAEAKAHLDAGTDPTAPAMRRIARRWKELVESFTGGSPKIATKLNKMYEQNPGAMQRMGGPDPALRDYVKRAMEEL